jgi:iron(III) transport system permease protein
LLIFVLVLESFETPAVLGLQAGIYVFTSRIYYALNHYPIDYGAAGAYSLGLLLIAATGVMISGALSRNARDFQTISGKAFRLRPIELGVWRPVVAAAVAGYFFVAVVLPVGVLFYASLLPFYQAPSAAAFSAMSFDNYAEVFGMSVAVDAFQHSLLLGIGAATIVMALTVIAAWVVTRTVASGRRWLDILAFSPLVVPGLVLGVALSYVYLRVPLPIYGTLWILLIAYTTKYLPYGMRYATAAMSHTSFELEESAMVSGASLLRTLRSILLPLASSGILAGWMYIVIVSFRELSSSILLYSPGSEVLSVLIWDQFTNGHFTTVAAIGVLMLAFLAALVALAHCLGAGFGVEAEGNA